MFESFSSRFSSEIFLGEEKHSVSFYSELYFFLHNTPLNASFRNVIKLEKLSYNYSAILNYSGLKDSLAIVLRFTFSVLWCKTFRMI